MRFYYAINTIIMITIFTITTCLAQSVEIYSSKSKLVLTKITETGLDIFRIFEGEDYLSVCSFDGNIYLFKYQESGSLVEVADLSIYTFPFFSIQKDSLLYVADRDSGLVIYDISNINDPIEMDRYYAEYIETMEIYKDYAYIFPRQESGMTILNIRDPSDIRFENTTDFSFNAICLKIKENHIYSGSLSKLMTIVNVSNPINPVITGTIEPEYGTYLKDIESIVLHGNYAYVVNNRSPWWPRPHYLEIYAINISDVSNPQEIGSFRTPGEPLTHNAGLAIYDDFLFAGMGKYNLNVFDISDPDSLLHLHRITDYSEDVQEIVIKDNYLYMATKSNGLVVLRIDIVSGINNDDKCITPPSNYVLFQNYPNPFNPSTTIAFELPKPEKVSVSIYNINGQVVRQLINNELKSAGNHKVQFNSNGLSSGIYLCRITSGNYSKTIKMSLVK